MDVNDVIGESKHYPYIINCIHFLVCVSFIFFLWFRNTSHHVSWTYIL